MRDRSRWGLALAVALAAAPVAAAGPAGTSAVALRFAWPDGAEGQRIERREGRADAARRTRLRVERRGEETWLSARPAEREADGAEEREEAPELPVIAGADGRFARLDRLDAWAEEEASFQVRIAASPAEADAARKAARENAAKLAADAREQWSYQVEAWAGRTVELGRTLETTGRIPVPAVPGLEVEQRVVLSARRWVSCTPGGLDQRCLELTLRADAGPDAFRRGLAAAGGKAAKGFEDGLLAVEVVLVTDPETLLPWRYTLTKKLRLVFAGRGLSVDQVERRERDYQWWKAKG